MLRILKNDFTQRFLMGFVLGTGLLLSLPGMSL